MPQETGFRQEKEKTLQLPEKQCGTCDSSRNSIQCFSSESRLQHSDDQLRDESRESSPQQRIHADMMKVKAKELLSKKAKERLFDESRSRQPLKKDSREETKYKHLEDTVSPRVLDESSESEQLGSWDEIQEVIESDFLISPGDIYPSRKVELQDTDVSEETLHKFQVLCEEQHEAFSKE